MKLTAFKVGGLVAHDYGDGATLDALKLQHALSKFIRRKKRAKKR